MNRTRVLLLFGGESSEHDISVLSARNVYAALDNEKYDVQLGYIDKTGKWWLVESFDDEMDLGEAHQLLPMLGNHGFVTAHAGVAVRPDVILPILHGVNGEDGSVQGLAQLLHIPIVGCGVGASSAGIDKVVSKRLAQSQGVPIVEYLVHTAGDPVPSYEEVVQQLGSTDVFVKPARAGSSVGVSKVHNGSELAVAITEAHHHDQRVLVERAIVGRELEVAMLGAPPNHKISGVGEIIPGEEFYSFQDKYSTASQSSLDIPAKVPDAVVAKIQEYAGLVYEALNCEGLSRIDFFLTDDDSIYFNEINTLPGFTNISMYPKLWRQEGVGYSELISTLIEAALLDYRS